MNRYFEKMKGITQSPPMVNYSEVIWSWIGAFLGILPVAWMNYHLFPSPVYEFIVGSFGASAVLIYGAIRSPLAQPRNLIGGHLISALIGVASYKLLHFNPGLAAPIAVATAIAAMLLTKTLHPPGGATALIAVIGSEKIHQLGFMYALVPVGLGAVIMLIVALIVNNIPNSRRYPEFWV